MNDDTADVDRLFARLSGEGPHRDPDDHPAPEKLSAYLANELSPEEDNDLQEHLAHCTLCTELLLDLQRFLDPPAEDLPREGVVDFETAAGWRELQGRMGSGAGTQEVSRPGRLRKVFGSLKVAYGLAAVLLVGLVGLGDYSLILIHGKKAPEADPIYLVLDPQGTTRSAEGGVADLKGKRRSIVIALTLKPLEPSDYSSFAAEFQGQEGLHFTVEDLHPQQGVATLGLHPENLQPGAVTITLWGIRGGKKNKVGDYLMTLVP